MEHALRSMPGNKSSQVMSNPSRLVIHADNDEEEACSCRVLSPDVGDFSGT